MAGVQLPISIATAGNAYTATLFAGSQAMPVAVILDTGSSVFALDGQTYSPDVDPSCQTTNIAQAVHYGTAAWAGAVVRMTVGLSATVALQAATASITYAVQPGLFSGANGILGLAFQALDAGHLMEADSWQSQYESDAIAARPAADVTPLFDQFRQAKLEPALFAFHVRRSMVRGAPAEALGDPANGGIFVAGGGPECRGLYTGGFTNLAVVDNIYYNVNLLGVQVDGQPLIPVKPAASGGVANANAIIDSGCSSLQLDQDLFAALLTQFAAHGAGFDTMIATYGINTRRFADQSTIDLTQWPNLRFTFQGADGGPAELLLTPAEYWQFDACSTGQAVAMLSGDGGKFGGQSILGLPLFARYFVVFDRTASNGHGVVAFAVQA